jgi:hypothetical protein
MSSVLSWLRGIRASNLIFLAVVPLLIYLVASSRNYGPALSAVLGIEDNPGRERFDGRVCCDHHDPAHP